MPRYYEILKTKKKKIKKKIRQQKIQIGNAIVQLDVVVNNWKYKSFQLDQKQFWQWQNFESNLRRS